MTVIRSQKRIQSVPFPRVREIAAVIIVIVAVFIVADLRRVDRGALYLARRIGTQGRDSVCRGWRLHSSGSSNLLRGATEFTLTIRQEVSRALQVK